MKENIRILILENEPNEAESLKDNLESYGWKPVVVQNVSSFKKKLESEDFDIFVVDYDIPEDRGHRERGGGDKALAILQKMNELAPVIVYSGRLEGEVDFKAIFSKGTPYVLEKGKGGSTLATMIKSIMVDPSKKIGLLVQSYLKDRIGEETFYMKLISETRTRKHDKDLIKVVVEVQRLFDDKKSTYVIIFDQDGKVINAKIK